MTSFTWTGAVSGQWSDAGNWLPDTAVPGAGAAIGADVTITGTGDVEGVDIFGFAPGYTISTLSLTGSSVANVAGTLFTVTTSMTLNNSTYNEQAIGSFGAVTLTAGSNLLVYAGSDTISGTLSLSGSSYLSVVGAPLSTAALTLDSSLLSLDDNGSVTVSGALTATGAQSMLENHGGTFSGNTANDTSMLWELGDSFTSASSVISFSGLVSGSGDTFEFFSTGADTVSFGAQGSSFGGNIEAFGGSNSVDLTQLIWNPNYVISPTAGGTGVTISLNGNAEFTFADFTRAYNETLGLALAPDSGTGTEVIIACFAAGTTIATPSGETPVQNLRPGDLVLTQTGPQPIIWTGRRTIDLTRHPAPEAARPIRIRRHAFAHNIPSRDLLLSPDHAVFWNAHLAESKRLINGTTITQDKPDTVTYYHLELPAHAILFANALPAESYLDTGNRGVFENSTTPRILHPAFTTLGPAACAPPAHHGEPLAAIRRHLLDRAQTLGFATTTNPGLHLLAGATRIDPQILPDGRHRFTIPKGATTLRLRSRAGRPAHLLADSADTRRLGLFVQTLTLTTSAGSSPISLTDPTLTEGWHPAEPKGRWTDGDAALNLAGPCIIEITAAGTLPYLHRRRAA